MKKFIPIQRILFEECVRGTSFESIVKYEIEMLCRLTSDVKKGLKIKKTKRVFINTRVLKHLCDKRPEDECESVLDNLHTVVKYPDEIRLNKPGARGEYCLLKTMKGRTFICPIEINVKNEIENISVVTIFWLRKEKYLKNLPLVWNWKQCRKSKQK